MKRKLNLLKALLCTAVIAAVPFAAQAVSADEVAEDTAAVVVEDVQPAAEAESVAPLATDEAVVEDEASEVTIQDDAEDPLTTLPFIVTDTDGNVVYDPTTTTETTPVEEEDTGVHLSDIEVTVSADTIKVGETAQINVALDPADTTDFTAVTYFSSDPSIATVDENGVITALAEGDVIISCTVYSSTTAIEINVQSAEIYSVLVLDISGSMSGAAIVAEREAAVKFCEDILKYNNDSHIAIVALGNRSDTRILSDFSSDLTQLTSIINNIDAYSGTYYAPALQLADDLLSTVPDTYPRSIVLCSDGDPSDAAAANALAESLKDKYTIYTLGFFHSYEAYDAREVLTNLATNEYCYYEVEDPEDLTVQFALIANNVAVNYDGPSFTKSVEITVEPAATTPAAPEAAPAVNSLKTGDNDFIIVYAAAALMGLAVIAFTAKRKRTN